MHTGEKASHFENVEVHWKSITQVTWFVFPCDSYYHWSTPFLNGWYPNIKATNGNRGFKLWRSLEPGMSSSRRHLIFPQSQERNPGPKDSKGHPFIIYGYQCLTVMLQFWHVPNNPPMASPSLPKTNIFRTDLHMHQSRIFSFTFVPDWLHWEAGSYYAGLWSRDVHKQTTNWPGHVYSWRWHVETGAQQCCAQMAKNNHWSTHSYIPLPSLWIIAWCHY